MLRESAHPAARSWVDIALAWVAGIVRDLLRGIDRALGEHNPYETAIGFVIIVLAFALAGVAITVLVRGIARGERPRSRAGVAAPGAFAEQRADALRAAALGAARACRYREAAALLFLAAERELDAAGRVTYDAARTPGELRQLVGDPTFDALAGDAVVALFAPAEPAAELFARMSASYDRFFGASAA